jgi:hypothetical protein
LKLLIAISYSLDKDVLEIRRLSVFSVTLTFSSIKYLKGCSDIDEKVRVTLNTDNRLISNTSLSNEYEIAINNFNLNENEIRTIIINGFKSAFLPHNKRRELIRQVTDELEREFNFSRHLII